MGKKISKAEVFKVFKGFLKAVNQARGKNYNGVHSVMGKDGSGRTFEMLLCDIYSIDVKTARKLIDEHFFTFWKTINGVKGKMIYLPDPDRKKADKLKEKPNKDFYLKLADAE